MILSTENIEFQILKTFHKSSSFFHISVLIVRENLGEVLYGKMCLMDLISHLLVANSVINSQA